MNVNGFILGLIVGLIVGESVVFALLSAGMIINDRKSGNERKEDK